MIENFKQINEDLKGIRTYLIKLGPSRRKGDILEKKIGEAKSLVLLHNKVLDETSKLVKSGKIDKREIQSIEVLSEIFQSLYSEIENLCKPIKMATFNLKTALSLLPIMTDEEYNTKQLIDGIEYYGSVIEQKDHANLIVFVLKSRLSQSAKLKLNTNYTTIDGLIKDMKLHLLTRKSATAIQTKLQNMRQNNLSIGEFGKSISELMVDLTISQAEGNTSSYQVLKSLNEKTAIKKFSDGLRNQRLSTIIAARNFSSLKEAIQAAQDEEVSSSSVQGEIMGMSNANNNNRYFRGNRYQRNGRGRYQRGQSRGPSAYRGHHQYQQHHQYRGGRGHQSNNWRGPPRGRGRYQGRSYYNNQGHRNYNDNKSLNVMSENTPETTQNNSENQQFFRE